ncbi:MAG: MFS transporter [Caldilineaceae bacterium]
MNSIRLLTLISAIFYVAIGISSPLITLYLQSLGASFAQISLILASVVITMFFANYLWGWLSDRIGRRKPLLVTGLLILSSAFFLLSWAPSGNFAWAARIFEGMGTAAYGTLSLAIMGDLLEAEKAKGRRMGIFRGIGSFGFFVGAMIGGRLADATSIATTLMLCSGIYLLAAFCALAIREIRPTEQRAILNRQLPALNPARSGQRSFAANLLLTRGNVVDSRTLGLGVDVAQLYAESGLQQNSQQQPLGAGCTS